MKYPKFIAPGDTIALVAPSFGLATEPYLTRTKRAIRKFEKLGYKIVEGPNVYLANLPYLSNNPKLVAKEFMDMYQKEDVSFLLSVGGGELQCETLPYLDFDILKESTPKWFCGFSDNTNYTFLLATLCDTASIYGHCSGAFGMYRWDPSIEDDFALWQGQKLTIKGYDKFQIRGTKYQKNHPLASYHLTEPKIITGYPTNEITMEGRLLGGCLDILDILCGTKYDKVCEFNERYQEDGIIWFLEACDLSALSIRRTLFKLKEAGWFQNVKGFLIGRPARAFQDDLFDVDRHQALEGLKELNVPILMDVDLGHLPPSMPLIVGSMARVVLHGNDLSVEMMLK